MDDFKASGRTQYPLQSGKGREESEKTFNDHLNCDVCDISEVPGGQSFMQASWMYAFDTDMKNCNISPNCTASLRFSWAGEVLILMIHTGTLVNQLMCSSEKDPKALSLADIISAVENADDKILMEWKAAGVDMVFHKHGPKQLLFIPQGWVIAECVQEIPGAGASPKLICGIRKAVITCSHDAADCYSHCQV